MPEKIQKRDGRLETWSVDRIAKALIKSLHASGIRDPLLAKRLAVSVEKHLSDTAVPEQEDVQDMVEQVLMEARLYSVARKYILYREKRRRIRSQDQAFLDVRDTIDTYVKNGRDKEQDANVPHSFRGLSRHLSGAVQKRYALEQYPEEIRMAHENGYLHIHELSFGMAGHAARWDTCSLLGKGFGFKGVTAQAAADHLDTALGQLLSFLGAMQGEWATTQTLNHFDTALAPFVREDGLDSQGLGRLLRNFVQALNAFCRGSEGIPLCVLGLDGTTPEHLQQVRVAVPEMSQAMRYSEYHKEAGMICQALCEVLLEGDHLGQSFASPVLAYSPGPGFSWDTLMGRRIMDLARKGRSLYLRMPGEGGGASRDGALRVADRAGAIGVVSLNLPKLAFLAGRESDFLDLIGEYAEYARQALEFKRKFILDYMESGMFPYSGYYLDKGLQHHFSMLALVGGHEACMNLLGEGIDSSRGSTLMKRVLDKLTTITRDFSQATQTPYAVTTMTHNPACWRLAGIDEGLYAEIAFSGNGKPHYTNGVHLPTGHALSLDDEIDHQAGLIAHFPGYPVLGISLVNRGASVDFPAIFQKVAALPGIVFMRVCGE